MIFRPFTLILLLSALLAGQGGLGSISGTVVDQTDAPIPGVVIKVRQLSTNSERTTETNSSGLFTVPSLVASKFDITISAQGFRTVTVSEQVLNTFQNLSLGRVTLEVGGGPVTTVEVADQIPKIITENAVRSETIQAEQVTEMPLQGRNWSALLKIIPGASPMRTQGINGREASYDGYADFRINGKAPNQTQVNLDGGSNVDHGSDSKTTVTPSLESIQEVSVLSNNFQAEYGNRAGVIVNIVTKSGTNNWNGTVWNYMRNEVLNARPWDRAYFGQEPEAGYPDADKPDPGANAAGTTGRLLADRERQRNAPDHLHAGIAGFRKARAGAKQHHSAEPHSPAWPGDHESLSRTEPEE